MGSSENRIRKIWQKYAGLQGLDAEKTFFNAFNDYFANSDFLIEHHPKDFKHIYEDVILPEKQQERIYIPNKKYTHGLSPDYAIRNKSNNRTLYIEIKRQDGWVENKEPKDGR